jgi:hypothetical protein
MAKVFKEQKWSDGKAVSTKIVPKLPKSPKPTRIYGGSGDSSKR